MKGEELTFKITLSSTHWQTVPEYEIAIDDHILAQGAVSSKTTVEFKHSLAYGAHCVKIRLTNKTDSDTVLVDGQIVKDMLLNLEDIEIDDVSIGPLIRTGKFVLDTPQEYQGQSIHEISECVNFGRNGTYLFNFSSPFFTWLLEEL